MDPQTVASLDEYYADLMGVDEDSVWTDVTVREHSGRLLDFDGLYVVRRRHGIHVSAPADAVTRIRRSLEAADWSATQELVFWQDAATELGRRVVGPSTHAYLDRDPGAVHEVREITRTELDELSREVDAPEWSESGWDDDPERMFGLAVDGRLLAAANLNRFHRRPRDVGVLVAPSVRGRGLALPVAQHAVSVAVRSAGFARWGALASNEASMAVSRRIGFEPWCSQLALR